MKSMKSLSVNKMLGSIRRKASTTISARNGEASSALTAATTPASTPEKTAHDSVKAFCESGGKSQNDEFLFLPPIVDAAESSPAAAAECARLIRKYLSKDYMSRPSWQYNAIMLVRILTDNPGETFTRNLDQKFVDTVRALLKGGRDPSVHQMLMETLEDFERTKAYDENLTLLTTMWKKEKEKTGYQGAPRHPNPGMLSQPPNPHSQNYFARNHTNKRLPDPVELASRLEEARTSAKLLEQVVMNTPPAEMLDNDLIKEFADRCLSASRSIQGYMTSENPCPDNNTMESLIDTNEQLQTALNQHKRAVLNARKALGLGLPTDTDSPVPTPEPNGNNRTLQWQGDLPPPTDLHNPDLPPRLPGKGKETEGYAPPPGPPPGVAVASGSGSTRPFSDEPLDNPFEDPFKDPQPAGSSSRDNRPSGGFDDSQRLGYESYHPGFSGSEGQSNHLQVSGGNGKPAAQGAGLSVSPDIDAPRRAPAHDVSDDEDLYDGPGNSKKPIYRY